MIGAAREGARKGMIGGVIAKKALRGELTVSWMKRGCQQRVLKTFPGPGIPLFENGEVWR